jgi:hypothetical protein
MKRAVDEQELLRRIGELPREIRPRTDPWPAIAARIERQPSKRFGVGPSRVWLWPAIAASLAVALTAGLLFGPDRGGPPSPSAADTVAMPAPRNPAAPATLAASEAEYQAAFREFITVGRARQGLSPETIQRIEAGWADLRQTEDALRDALAQSPGNAFLADRMMELRARQLGFLQQLAELDRDYRRLMT